jgi:hypothetical protein
VRGQNGDVNRRFRPLVAFVLAVVVGSLALNRATGDSWAGAFTSFGVALAIGAIGGGAYYLVGRLANRT